MRLSRVPDCGGGPTRRPETHTIVALRTGLADSTLPDDPDYSAHSLDVSAMHALYRST